jgi:hypothetical protein
MAADPKFGAYGTYGDASLLADYLELLALQDKPMSKAELADLIADSSMTSWRARDEELFTPAGSSSEKTEEEEEQDGADRVFSFFSERERLLGTDYPFTLAADRLVRRVSPTPVSPYLALLAITVAHAYEVVTLEPPTIAFEAFVAAAVQGRCVDTINFAAMRGRYRSFDDALEAEGPSIGLQPTPSAIVRKRKAVDEKGDILGHLDWHDARPDTWTWIGQATCAKTNEWEQKIEETSDIHWQGYLGLVVPPSVFLAVPHHADAEHRRYVTSRSQRVLLDRLRLATARTDVSDVEVDIYEAVSAVDWGRP